MPKIINVLTNIFVGQQIKFKKLLFEAFEAYKLIHATFTIIYLGDWIIFLESTHKI